MYSCRSCSKKRKDDKGSDRDTVGLRADGRPTMHVIPCHVRVTKRVVTPGPCPLLASLPPQGLHKPNQQTVVLERAVPGLLRPLPIARLRSLGGKFGQELQERLGVKTVGACAGRCGVRKGAQAQELSPVRQDTGKRCMRICHLDPTSSLVVPQPSAPA